MITTVIVGFISVITFLFVFWRKLKEDYIAERIFSTAFYMLFAVLAFSSFVLYYFPNWWFWGGIFGALTGLVIGVNRYRLRFYEVADAAVAAMLPWGMGVFLIDVVKTGNLISLIPLGFILFLIILYLFIDKRYKRFLWYRSGRVGFTGMMILGLFFTARAVVAAYAPNMLSLVGFYDVIVSGVIAFFAYSSVIILAKE